MIELVLIAGCAFGSYDGCLNIGQAYYKYSGIEPYVQKIGQQHIWLSHTVFLVAVMTEKKLTIPITSEFSQTVTSNSTILNFKRGF